MGALHLLKRNKTLTSILFDISLRPLLETAHLLAGKCQTAFSSPVTIKVGLE